MARKTKEPETLFEEPVEVSILKSGNFITDLLHVASHSDVDRDQLGQELIHNFDQDRFFATANSGVLAGVEGGLHGLGSSDSIKTKEELVTKVREIAQELASRGWYNPDLNMFFVASWAPTIFQFQQHDEEVKDWLAKKFNGSLKKGLEEEADKQGVSEGAILYEFYRTKTGGKLTGKFNFIPPPGEKNLPQDYKNELSDYIPETENHFSVLKERGKALLWKAGQAEENGIENREWANYLDVFSRPEVETDTKSAMISQYFYDNVKKGGEIVPEIRTVPAIVGMNDEQTTALQDFIVSQQLPDVVGENPPIFEPLLNALVAKDRTVTPDFWNLYVENLKSGKENDYGQVQAEKIISTLERLDDSSLDKTLIHDQGVCDLYANALESTYVVGTVADSLFIQRSDTLFDKIRDGHGRLADSLEKRVQSEQNRLVDLPDLGKALIGCLQRGEIITPSLAGRYVTALQHVPIMVPNEQTIHGSLDGLRGAGIDVAALPGVLEVFAEVLKAQTRYDMANANKSFMDASDDVLQAERGRDDLTAVFKQWRQAQMEQGYRSMSPVEQHTFEDSLEQGRQHLTEELLEQRRLNSAVSMAAGLSRQRSTGPLTATHGVQLAPSFHEVAGTQPSERPAWDYYQGLKIPKVDTLVYPIVKRYLQRYLTDPSSPGAGKSFYDWAFRTDTQHIFGTINWVNDQLDAEFPERIPHWQVAYAIANILNTLNSPHRDIIDSIKIQLTKIEQDRAEMGEPVEGEEYDPDLDFDKLFRTLAPSRMGRRGIRLFKVSMPVSLYRHDENEHIEDFSGFPQDLYEEAFGNQFGTNFPRPVDPQTGELLPLHTLADIVERLSIYEEQPRRVKWNMDVYDAFLGWVRHPFTGRIFLPEDANDSMYFDDSAATSGGERLWYDPGDPIDRQTLPSGVRLTDGREYLARAWAEFGRKYGFSVASIWHPMTLRAFNELGYQFPTSPPPPLAPGGGAEYMGRSIQSIDNVIAVFLQTARQSGAIPPIVNVNPPTPPPPDVDITMEWKTYCERTFRTQAQRDANLGGPGFSLEDVKIQGAMRIARTEASGPTRSGYTLDAAGLGLPDNFKVYKEISGLHERSLMRPNVAALSDFFTDAYLQEAHSHPALGRRYSSCFHNRDDIVEWLIYGAPGKFGNYKQAVSLAIKIEELAEGDEGEGEEYDPEPDFVRLFGTSRV